MKFGVCLVVAMTAALAAPDPATANPICRLCAPGEGHAAAGEAKTPIGIEVDTYLDFDRLIVTGAGSGAARLMPDGTKITTGVLQGLRTRSVVGTVIIRGEPGRTVQVDLPGQIELFGNGGGQILVRRIASDLPSEPRLDSSGRLVVRFGGELQVNGEADGEYRGEIPIIVQYL